jgi:hypothetical protein
MVAYATTGHTDFLTALYDLEASSMTNGVFVGDALIDLASFAAPDATTTAQFRQPFVEGHRGRAMRQTNAGWSSSIHHNYNFTVRPSALSEQLITQGVECLDGRMGWEVLQDHPESKFDAPMELTDEMATWVPDVSGDFQWATTNRAAWEEWRPLNGRPMLEATPTQAEWSWDGGTPNTSAIRASTPGAGQIAFDFADFADPRAWSTLDKTATYYRFSLDGIQTLETSRGVTAGDYTPTFTEVAPGIDIMPGLQHLLSFDWANSLGRAPMPMPYHQFRAALNNPRFPITPAGTAPTGTPTWAVDPQLFYAGKPAWSQKLWTPEVATLPDNVFEVAVGKGYPATGLPSSYSFWIERNDGTDGSPSWVTTETAQAAGTFTLTNPLVLGKKIRGAATMTNGSGTSATAYTAGAGMLVPAKPSFDANIRLATRGPDINLWWPTAWSSKVTVGGSPVLLTGGWFDVDSEGDFTDELCPPGGVAVDKTGQFPTIWLPFGAVTPGQQVRFRFAVVRGLSVEGSWSDNASFTAALNVRLRPSASVSGTAAFTQTLAAPTLGYGGDPQRHRPVADLIDATVTIPSGWSAAWVEVRSSASGANVSGGDIIVAPHPDVGYIQFEMV